MFPKIRRLMDSAELEQLGEQIEEAKHKRMRKAS